MSTATCLRQKARASQRSRPRWTSERLHKKRSAAGVRTQAQA
jgi:hypothetical protein